MAGAIATTIITATGTATGATGITTTIIIGDGTTGTIITATTTAAIGIITMAITGTGIIATAGNGCCDGRPPAPLPAGRPRP